MIIIVIAFSVLYIVLLYYITMSYKDLYMLNDDNEKRILQLEKRIEENNKQHEIDNQKLNNELIEIKNKLKSLERKKKKNE